MRWVPLSFFAIASVLAVYACEESSGDPNGLDPSFDASLDVARPDTATPADARLDAPAEAAADSAASDGGLDGGDAGDANVDPEPDPGDGGPILVASGYGEVLTVIADTRNVYFTTYGTKDGGAYNKDGTVVRCPISGGCAASSTVLASGIDNPLFIAIEGSTLIIGSAGAVGSGQRDGHVYSCPLAGCGANNADRITLSPNLQNLGGIAARSGYAYWVHTPTDSTCGRALFDGGSQQLLGNANGLPSIAVTVDDANAYWAHSYYPPALHVAPFDGGGGRVLVNLPAVDGGIDPRGVTHENGYLYYVATFEGRVHRVQVDGGGLTTLADGMHGPAWFALDATHIYVADYYDPRPIRRVPKGGGAATVIANSVAQITGLALNNRSFFWSTASGQVWRQAK